MPPSIRFAPWSETTEHGGVVVREPQQPPHLLVDAAVVVEHRVLELVVGLVQPVLRVEVAPERVVDAVGAHLDHEEEVPRPRLEQVLRDLEPALGHRLDVAQHARLVLRPEVRHVDHVLADEPLDLLLERGRIRVLTGRVRGEEARDHDAVHRRHRIGLRDAEYDDRAALPAEEIPHPRHPDRTRVGEAHRVVAVVLAVAEAVEAEDSGAPRRGHHRPRGHRDRRVAAPQDAEAAALGEAPDVRELVEPLVEDELRRGAVEADDEGAAGHRRPSVAPAGWVPMGKVADFVVSSLVDLLNEHTRRGRSSISAPSR